MSKPLAFAFALAASAVLAAGVAGSTLPVTAELPFDFADLWELAKEYWPDLRRVAEDLFAGLTR